MIELIREGSFPEISSDIDILLNQAYCTSILLRYIYSYQQASITSLNSGMPYLLTYLCLPLTLHAPTREEINKHMTSYGFHRFIGSHPTTLVYLAERVQDLVPLTRESLLFGATHGLLKINQEMALVTTTSQVVRQATALLQHETEAMQPMRAASRLGLWFSQLTVAEIFFYLGLYP